MINFINGALLCAFLISVHGKAQNNVLVTTIPESQEKVVADSSALLSCDRESCFCDNDLTPAGVMISHVHDKGEWMLAYRYMQMNMQGQRSGTERIGTDEVLKQYTATGNTMNMRMHMLMAMYGLNDRLTVMGMLHYNTNYMEMTMKTANHLHSHGMKTSGIGDSRLSVLYALVKKEQVELIVNAGLNLPTGAIALKGNALDMMYPGSRLPYNMQLGSGSWDLLPGITYLYRREKWSLSAQLIPTLHLFNNPLGYRYGNECTATFWYAYGWLPFISSSLRLEASYVEKIKHADASLAVYNEPSSNAANYGGRFLTSYLSTSIAVKRGLLKRLHLGLEYGIPLYQNFNGIQMPTKQNLIINSFFKF